MADGLDSITGTYQLAGALTLGQVIPMVKLPAGATVHSWSLTVPKLDNNVVPAIMLQLGDGSDVDRFMTANAAGKAGGVVNGELVDFYRYAVADSVDLRVSTAPATGALTGEISLTVYYYLSRPKSYLRQKVLEVLGVIGADEQPTPEDAALADSSLEEIHEEIRQRKWNIKQDLTWPLDYVPQYASKSYAWLAAEPLLTTFGVTGELAQRVSAGAAGAPARLVAAIRPTASEDSQEAKYY